MLKNKKAIYLLIPLNLAIWGFFIYRFWSAWGESDVPAGNSRIAVSTFKNTKDSITYHLALSYKDPFLKESGKSVREYQPAEASSHPKATIARPVVTAAPATKETPPDIKYLGLIKNNSSGITTALVSVNGQSRLIKPNETIDGFLFKSFNKDSLVARRGKEKFVVMK